MTARGRATMMRIALLPIVLWSCAAFAVGAAFFPWLAGRLFDLSGTYNTAFLLAAGAIFVSTTLLWIAPRLLPRRKKAVNYL